MFRNSSGGGPIRQRRCRVRAPRQLTFKVSMLKSATVSHCRSHRGEFTYMNTFLKKNFFHSDNALGRSALYIHLKVSKLLYNIYIILKYSKHGCTAHRYGMILDSKLIIDARTIIHGLHKFYACILLTTNKCLSI